APFFACVLTSDSEPVRMSISDFALANLNNLFIYNSLCFYAAARVASPVIWIPAGNYGIKMSCFRY
ncbi:hypothetical protein OFM36_37655, partial [Escherichia coli]|nr:hypothetical protein [Escherichia coli]